MKKQVKSQSTSSVGGAYDSARPKPGSRRRVSPFILHPSAFILSLLVAGSVLPCPSPAADALGAAAPTYEQLSLLAVIIGLGVLITMVNGILGVWDKLKAKPPLHEQFAPHDHQHMGDISKTECQSRHDELVAETRHMIRHATGDREAIQRQLDTVVTTLRAEIKDNDRKAEERASETHSRINGISGPLNSLIGRFEDHLRFSGKKTQELNHD